MLSTLCIGDNIRLIKDTYRNINCLGKSEVLLSCKHACAVRIEVLVYKKHTNILNEQWRNKNPRGAIFASCNQYLPINLGVIATNLTQDVKMQDQNPHKTGVILTSVN
jgi:hypothetical protein